MSSTKEQYQLSLSKVAIEEQRVKQHTDNRDLAKKRLDDAEVKLAASQRELADLRTQSNALLNQLQSEAKAQASKETGDQIRAEADVARAALLDQIAKLKQESDDLRKQLQKAK